MVYLFFTALFLLPVFAGFGKLYELFFGKLWNGVSGKLVSGILMTSVLWLSLSFFKGISLSIEIGTISVGLFSFFYFEIYNEFWSFFTENKKIFSFISVLVFFAGSFFPFILDHFGYYVPTVKWLSEYGLVKGISNLDLLLGQMSVWHILQAGFSHFADPFLRLNAVLLIIYLIYILERKSWLQLLFLPVLFLFVQSPSPDLPVFVFSLMMLNEIISNNTKTASLFALSVFIFVIKPTMIWVPILALLYAFFKVKSALKFVALGSIIFLLFIAKNLWCFGYPVFPVQFGEVGVSWKPNADLLRISSETAIQKTFDMQFSYAEIQQFSTSDYIKNWLFLKGIKSKIHLFFIISLLVFTIFSFIKKKKIIAFVCAAVLIKSILVLLFSAQYRFFIDVFFVIPFVMLYEKVTKKQMLMAFSVFSFVFFLFFSFPDLIKKAVPSFKLGQYMTGFQKAQLLKPSYFEWKQFKTHQIGNLKFNLVEKYPFSFDIPIPAISPEFLQEDLDAGIFPQQNSSCVKDGFHWRRLSPEEKQRLQIILNNWKAEMSNK